MKVDHGRHGATVRPSQAADLARTTEAPSFETFAVVGRPEGIGPELHRRCGDIADRVTSYEQPKARPAANAWIAIAQIPRQHDPRSNERAHR